MTVLTLQSSRSFNGNDVATDFPTGFRFLASAHLTVQRITAGVTTTLLEGVDYDVSGAGDDAGGTVELHAALATGSVLYVERNTPILQEVSLRDEGDFLPPVHELIADRLTMICQELARDVAAALAGTVGSTYAATRAQATFVMGEPPEGSPFPLAVNFGVVPATIVVGRVENLTNPAEVRTEASSVPQYIVAGTTATIPYITGLTPGQQYRVTFEART